MLIIPIKEGNNIERAIKQLKKKFERTGVLRELRTRKEFTKPSVSRRTTKQKAAYREKMQREMY